ncbi:MAG: hypothetical protein R3E95_20875 [Thiolinea sp.]
MQMAAGLDTGDMLHKQTIPIAAREGGRHIHDVLAELGAQALLHTLALLAAGQLQPEPQDDALSCYAHKLSKAEAALDWSQPAAVLDRKIRAFDAWPTAFTYYQGSPLRLFSSVLPPADLIPEVAAAEPGTVIAESRDGLDVVTGDGQVVRILELQLPGGKRLPVAEFVKARTLLGCRFASTDQEAEH